jgi:branched-chain amino acid transport system ATP-binding protein
MMGEPLLAIRDVSLSFRGVKALSELSLSVARREICALIGPNGAGKSSLLNIINGVYRASSGEIVFDGEPFQRPTPMAAAQRGIGRTFQNNALFHRMSVIDNVLTGLTRLGRSTFLEIAFRVGRHGAERRSSARGPTRSSIFLRSRRIAKLWSGPSPTDSRSGSNSPARSWPLRNSSCSTSLWRE